MKFKQYLTTVNDIYNTAEVTLEDSLDEGCSRIEHFVGKFYHEYKVFFDIVKGLTDNCIDSVKMTDKGVGVNFELFVNETHNPDDIFDFLAPLMHGFNTNFSLRVTLSNSGNIDIYIEHLYNIEE